MHGNEMLNCYNLLTYCFAFNSGASTQKLTQAEGNELLAAQRKNRPVSPHMEIYDVNQIYLGASIWTRFTGMFFGGGLYAFSIAYLAAPLTGWHIESATLAAAFAGLPVAAKFGLKFLTAWPFMFHFAAGVRHFAYDMAMGFSKPQIKTSSWAIWGASLGAALALAASY